ncbi:hypothetical protein F7725_001685 [Dissostichus mawsoni]|uniref:Uncharacterized protein n=1 Tax=Dissostichus mawsoni TaxID=36200 RepID=A0A7J5Y0D1_DISMA|nr:hypothetical protein F7725_001685 [Dissostichus mawsoni]
MMPRVFWKPSSSAGSFGTVSLVRNVKQNAAVPPSEGSGEQGVVDVDLHQRLAQGLTAQRVVHLDLQPTGLRLADLGPHDITKPSQPQIRTQKRKAEETEDLEVQEDSTESPTRERKGRKCEDVSPCPSKSKSKPEVGKGDKGKGKAQHENPPLEEAIARWVESNKLLYDMKDKQYKDKALRRQLWEGKAAEYGSFNSEMVPHTEDSILEAAGGPTKKKSQKRSGDGLSSGDEEHPILAEEASENDSDRDKFIRRVFGFMKPHIRRHKKDTPASFKEKLALLRRSAHLPPTQESANFNRRVPSQRYLLLRQQSSSQVPASGLEPTSGISVEIQECGYVEQANQQYNLEQQQQQQYHTLQPASTSTQGYVPSPRQAAFFQLPSQPPQQQIRGPWQLTPQQPVQGRPPPPLPAQQSQHNESLNALLDLLGQERRHSWGATIETLVFLFWLACGTSYRVVSRAFGMPRTTVHRIVHRVTEEVVAIRHQVIYLPRTAEDLEAGTNCVQRCLPWRVPMHGPPIYIRVYDLAKWRSQGRSLIAEVTGLWTPGSLAPSHTCLHSCQHDALVCMEDTPNTPVCAEDTPSTPVRTEDTPNTPVRTEDTHSKNSGNHSKSSRDRKRQQCRHPFSARVGHKAEVMRSNYRVDSLNKISKAKSPESNAGGAGRGTKRRRDALGS